MTVIDASIVIMQQATKDLLAKVESGAILSDQEAKAILQLRRDLVAIQTIDVRNEAVYKRMNLKTITDKWQ